MNVLGITGSSGAGKSTICKMLEKEYDVKIINADAIAKKLSKKGTSYTREIIDQFGIDILDEEGELKRKKLAEIIYTDPKKRQLLNNCTFKYIKKEIENQIKKENKISTIVIDAPLLFESNLNEICDVVIGIISNRELQIERIVARDNVSYEHAEKRINAQASNEFYISHCDEIIENHNDLSRIEEEINEIAEKYNITKKLQ